MTKTKKLRVLQEIYASIPSPNCKGLCIDECSTIPVFPFELEQLETAAGRKLPTISTRDDILLGELGKPCPLLVMGRCSVYAARPIICRAYGSTEDLLCAHGCRPEKLVDKRTQYENFERMAAL
jgi:Fe-S-cluster containining protein